MWFREEGREGRLTGEETPILEITEEINYIKTKIPKGIVKRPQEETEDPIYFKGMINSLIYHIM